MTRFFSSPEETAVAPWLTRLVWLLAFLLAPAPAIACQCASSLEQAFFSADRVVLAQASAARAHAVYFEVELAEPLMLKGRAVNARVHVTGVPGLLCGMGYIAVGRKYLFFLNDAATSEGHRVRSAGCRSFELGDRASREHLVTVFELAGNDPRRELWPECMRAAELRLALNQLLARYTHQHPTIVSVLAMLDEHESRLQRTHPGESPEAVCRRLTVDRVKSAREGRRSDLLAPRRE